MHSPLHSHTSPAAGCARPTGLQSSPVCTCGLLALGHNPSFPNPHGTWEKRNKASNILPPSKLGLIGWNLCIHSMTSAALYHNFTHCPYISILNKHDTHISYSTVFNSPASQCCSDANTPLAMTAGLAYFCLGTHRCACMN